MQILKMQKKFLDVFLESTTKYGTLYGPVRDNGHLKYDQIENVKDLVLSDERPLIPVKKLFHPMNFDMFTFDETGFTPDYSTIEKRVVVGVHPCEIHSLLVLDTVFRKVPLDPYYSKQRDNSIIIGFSCLPGESCLCIHTGTDRVNEGYDLFLVDVEDFYLVLVGSSRGHDLIYDKEEFFDANLSDADMKQYVDFQEKREKLLTEKTEDYNFRNMREIMEMTHDSKVWEYFGEKCLSCGQCSMVCPVCNCYNVVDHFEVTNEQKGRRERTWDSCMFQDYSLVAGGHNFRGDRADRLKLWYTHKLKAFGGRFGKPSCIGCGRCTTTCPVDINVLTISNALTNNEVPKE